MNTYFKTSFCQQPWGSDDIRNSCFPFGWNLNQLACVTGMRLERKSNPWQQDRSGVKSLNSHLIPEHLYSQEDRGNQIRPDENKNRNRCWNTFMRGKKRGTSCVRLCRSYLTAIGSIQPSSTFVTLKKGETDGRNRNQEEDYSWKTRLGQRYDYEDKLTLKPL